MALANEGLFWADLGTILRYPVSAMGVMVFGMYEVAGYVSQGR